MPREPRPVLKQPFSLKPFVATILNKLFNSAGDSVGQLAENDGTERSQLILHDGTVQRRWLSETDGKATESLYGKDGATSRPFGIEATNEAEVSNYGKAAGTVTAFKVETTGEQDVVNHGKTSGGAIGAFRINANNQLQIEIVGSTSVPSARKMLGQAAPAATTETTLYTVPASTSAEVTSLWVAERNGVAATFRISISVGGGATANKDYIAYNVAIAANAALELLNGAKLMLAATDVVRVFASTADLSFNASGLEYA